MRPGRSRPDGRRRGSIKASKPCRRLLPAPGSSRRFQLNDERSDSANDAELTSAAAAHVEENVGGSRKPGSSGNNRRLCRLPPFACCIFWSKQAS